MFKTKRISKLKQLDMEIESVTESLMDIKPFDERYEKIVNNLDRLYEVRNLTVKNKVSADTIAMIGANLLGIGLILKFEQLDVISTKAMSFVMKGRV